MLIKRPDPEAPRSAGLGGRRGGAGKGRRNGPLRHLRNSGLELQNARRAGRGGGGEQGGKESAGEGKVVTVRGQGELAGKIRGGRSKSKGTVETLKKIKE